MAAQLSTAETIMVTDALRTNAERLRRVKRHAERRTNSKILESANRLIHQNNVLLNRLLGSL